MCAAWQRNVAHSSIETEISSEAASKIAILTTSCVSSDTQEVVSVTAIPFQCLIWTF